MAIIVDPDNLSRDEVIFGSTAQKVSLFPVAATSVNNRVERSDGVTTVTSNSFTSAAGLFISDGITPGDVLVLKSNLEAGHWEVNNVFTETFLDVVPNPANTQAFVNGTENANYVVKANSLASGSIADGVAEQTLYSFGKEEWRVDSELTGGDDLIRHEFPYEPITAEQFEIGGGTTHADWTYFNDFTKKKIRTGGWADRNTAGTTLAEYAGIITLGSLDADTQVYYQNISGADPINFDFLGAVNEPIITFANGGQDNRQFLRLFARKKARSYAGSQISDIGVTTIQPIVNRFPLAHALDAAIVATDAEILGKPPFRGNVELASGTNGVTADVNGTTGTFSSAGATFLTDLVAANDTVNIQTGTSDIGYFTILTVDSETQVTVDTIEHGAFVGESAHNYAIDTTTKVAIRTGDGLVSDVINAQARNVSVATGNIFTTNTDFVANSVAIGDIALIRSTASNLVGAYKVTSVISNQEIEVNTQDRVFTTELDCNIRVHAKGMYLQFKDDNISQKLDEVSFFPAAGGANANIVLTANSWITDAGANDGDCIRFSGSANNDALFTIANVTNSILELVSTDVLNPQSNVGLQYTINELFRRPIGAETFAFHWRLFGVDALLSENFQFVQHQLRQTTDIDFGPGVSRGDITDLLMTFASPTGTTLDMFIDDLASADINNITVRDKTGNNRNFPFTAAGTLNFNVNLTNDAAAKYTLFFTNDDAGDDLARDFGTVDAIIVKDANTTPNDITGFVNGPDHKGGGGGASISFTYDYDGNVQRGSASAGLDAPVTLVAIGLSTAQYVLVSGTITRSTAITISAVAALERNYLNP